MSKIDYFSKDKYVKTFDSNEEVRLGGFQTATNGMIDSIKVLIYIRDFATFAGSETMIMKLYSSTKYESVYITSETRLLSDITFDSSDPSKPNHLGYLSFQFAPKWLSENKEYFPTVTIANYTPNNNLFYCGLCYDYPFPVNQDHGSRFFDYPIAMQLFLGRVRSI